MRDFENMTLDIIYLSSKLPEGYAHRIIERILGYVYYEGYNDGVQSQGSANTEIVETMSTNTKETRGDSN